MMLNTPFLCQKEWFPGLLDLLVDFPVALPQLRDLLRQPHFHMFRQNLRVSRLTVWRLASDLPSVPDSLVKCLNSLSSRGISLPC